MAGPVAPRIHPDRRLLPGVVGSLAVPDPVLRRYNARVLDPATAVRLPGQDLDSTVYVADELIVPTARYRDVVAALSEVAKRFGVAVSETDLPTFPTTGRVVRLAPASPRRPAQVDAWTILQWARAESHGELKGVDLTGVGLNHLMFAHVLPDQGTIIAQPYDEPHHPVTNALSSLVGMEGWDGYAGPFPVNVVIDAPAQPTAVGPDNPVIAVVDTGCGSHPWFTGALYKELDFTNTANSPEAPVLWTGDNLDGARPFAAGHGTFICGLIRQNYPAAHVFPVRALHADGVAIEAEVGQALDTIKGVATGQITGKDLPPRVDVVSLSFGFYHEELSQADESSLHTSLSKLYQAGPKIVASAGNDATTRPMLPAAFGNLPASTKNVGTANDPLKVISVGALNPNGTVASFSNGGDWVKEWAAGVALVSTMPPLDYGVQAAVSRDDQDPDRQATRQTLDLDDFRSATTDSAGNREGGFAQWSGTSFAVPLVAVNYARPDGSDGAAGATILPVQSS